MYTPHQVPPPVVSGPPPYGMQPIHAPGGIPHPTSFIAPMSIPQAPPPHHSTYPMSGMPPVGNRTHIGGPGDFDQLGLASQLQFTNESERQEYYRQSKCSKNLFRPILCAIEDNKVPAYSTLNLDVLPTPGFLTSLETYQAKVDPELLKEMVKSAGMSTSDDRVYKMLAAMIEIKLLQLLKEVRNVSATSSSA